MAEPRTEQNGKPKLTYADPEDSRIKVALIRAIEVATGRLKLERIYRKLKADPTRIDAFFGDALKLGRIDIDQDGLEAHNIPTGRAAGFYCQPSLRAG